MDEGKAKSFDIIHSFEHTLGNLEHSLHDLKNLARHIVPESLFYHGLRHTLHHFCQELTHLHTKEVVFQFFGEFNRFEHEMECAVFHIVHELVHNALKHSGAEEFLVQLIQEPTRLCLIIQDNGKGFDISNLQNTKGLGLSYVYSFVQAHNGTIEFSSRASVGTEVTVEFPLR